MAVTITTAPAPSIDVIADYLMSLVPHYYRTSRYYTAIIHADSLEFQLMQAALVDILTNALPTQALDWGLQKWEATLGLPIAPNLTIEERRNAILIKLLSVGTPSKPDLVRAIFNTFGIDASIFEPDTELLYLSERGGLSDDGHIIDYDYWSMNTIDVTIVGTGDGLSTWLDQNIPAGIKWWMTRLLQAFIPPRGDTLVWADYDRGFEAAVDLGDGMKPSQIGTLSDEPKYLSDRRLVTARYERRNETIFYNRELLLAGNTTILAGSTEYTAGQIALDDTTSVWLQITSEDI